MDGVPLEFVESVVRNSDICTSEELEQLSSAWGRVGEVQTKNNGQLFLSFDPPYMNEDEDEKWRLHYKMEGFDHIKSRTLSRDVIREMSKSITSIQFNVDYYDTIGEDWHSFGPDDVNIVQLLTNLDAPIKELDIFSFKRSIGESCHLKLRSKYSNLFRSFTSVKLNCFEDTRLMEGTICEPRVHSVEINRYGKRSRPTDFWVDFFFSEHCTRLTLKSDDVVLAAIKHWIKMDPRTLKYSKVLAGNDCHLDTLLDNIYFMGDMCMWETKDDTGSFRNRVRKNIFLLDQKADIEQVHCVEHPVDKSSKIYVVYYYEWHTEAKDLAVLFA
uniref:FBA_2 domain-containing protein n=1 Tax=Steinernema glaseri TaxID=37863 RepID=A0A1I7Z929_9BILA